MNFKISNMHNAHNQLTDNITKSNAYIFDTIKPSVAINSRNVQWCLWISTALETAFRYQRTRWTKKLTNRIQQNAQPTF